MRELRNALAIARDEFFASLSGATLEGAPSGKYLRNRLELAFVSGWDAREKQSPASPASKPAGEDARDAERYQWLRNCSLNQYEHPIVVSQERVDDHMRYIGPVMAKDLDQAIDQAIARQRAGETPPGDPSGA